MMQAYDNAAKAYRTPAMLPHRDFVYWLQGFFEIANPETLNADQVKIIKEHLAMCFEHVAAPAPIMQPGDLFPGVGIGLAASAQSAADKSLIAIC